eukprot:scaffold1221_cov207-Amphora_coffeaeformis.AAC.29
MILFVALTLLSAGLRAASAAGNPQGCLTESINPNQDYFPDKVKPLYSKYWDVTYHKTYKIAKNVEDGTSYLLYQCGTEPPTGMEGTVNLTLPIPLQGGIALSTTPHLPHMELLGVRDEIKAYLGDRQWISSPCMNERFVNGETINIAAPTEDGAIQRLYEATDPDIVLFHNPGFNANVTNRVSASASTERANHGIGEWHKYFSVFFNLEAKANADFQGIYERYECTKRNAQTVMADQPKKKVVVAEFSTFCGGWSVGGCPNFYCDHIRDCSAEIIENDNVGSIVNPRCGTERNYKTAQEFAEFAKDADVWIYPGHGDYYFDTAYADFKEDLDTMKSVQTKQVYDTVLTDLNTWYEHRLVEYGTLSV